MSFKDKPLKKIVADKRITVDALHNEMVDGFKVKKKEEPHVDDDGPAKLIFDLIKNKKPIMNMELRFKGGVTSQPQFFGTMTKEFKEVLKGECL